MSILCNLLWLILGGFLVGLGWYIVGALWCLTVVGVPVGVQCFKIAAVVMCPFGRELVPGTRPTSLLLNILWIIFGGVELAAGALSAGLVCCVTIVGIPFGMQFFKIAYVSLMPFGTEIRRL